jgi:DNA-binding MarR family transcriptional regulator
MISVTDDPVSVTVRGVSARARGRRAGEVGGNIPAALADRLPFLLKRTQRRLAAVEGPALAAFDLDGRQFAVLALLAGEGPMRQQQLSDRVQVDRTTVVALVDGLEAKGFVERRRDPADRRAHVVRPTVKGRATLRRATTAVESAEREFLDPLAPSEARQLKNMLARLVSAGD